MLYLKSFIVLLVLTVIESNVVDYSQYCDEKCGTNHIGCNPTGEFGAACNEAKVVDMADYQERIRGKLNKIRNEVASGRTHLKAAKNMPTLLWDMELEALALLNAGTCEMKNDKCHTTKRFPYAGQSIGMFGYSGSESRKTDKEIFDIIINQWIDQNKTLTDDVVKKFTADKLSTVGHITTILNEKNTHMGCGAIRHKDKKQSNIFIVTCNFAYTNMIGATSYETGPASSGCKTGKNPNYPSLCSEKEKQ